MEKLVARRRINLIAGHFAAANPDASATHVFPVNCSSTLNPAIRRCDNRMFFARQCSNSQACFMRQVSIEQGCSGLSGTPFKCSGYSTASSVAPMFSRPASMEPNFSNTGVIPYAAQDCLLSDSDPPTFARPGRTIGGEKQFQAEKKIQASSSNGSDLT